MAQSLEDIIREKLDRFETVPNTFGKGVKEVQYSLMEEMLDLLEMLGRNEDGTIKLTKKNLLVIEDILEGLQKTFNKSDYISLVKEFVSEFDTQAKITDDFFSKSFDEFTDPSSFSEAALKRAKAMSYELMAGTPVVTVNLYNPIEQLLVNAVSAGDSYTKTVRDIRRIITGDREVDGKLYRYSKQIAYDSFAVADRAYTNQIAEDIAVEWYVYRGGLVEDSRQFCITRNGKYYHRKEVEAWGNLGDWSGKIPATDSKTIFIYAGGYNCFHHPLPTSISDVPKKDIQRNIRNGNFKPNEKQEQVLGLK